MHKRILSLLLALVLLLGIVPVAASALSASDLSGATTVDLGKTYSHTWPKPENWYDNHDSVFYKLTLEKGGFLTINLARPYDSIYSSYEEVYFKFYNANDTSSYLINMDSDYAKDIDKENCTMQVCLAKGTYYVEVSPDSYATDDCDLTASYSFTLDAKEYTEIEKNNGRTTATPMELGHMYYASYGSGDSADTFSFNVEAGHKYVITFDNFVEVEDSSIILKVVLPGGTSVSPLYYAEDYVDANGNNYYIFEVEKSGTAYIDVDNYSNRHILYGIQIDDAAIYHTHNYVPTVTLPTCGKDGYTTYKCACGESYTDDAMPATGLHTYTNEYDTACDRCSATREAPANSQTSADIYSDVGDYASKAYPITPRGAGGSLIGDDEDWYKFEITQKSKITLHGASDWQYIHYYIYNADRSLYWRDTYWGYNGSHHQRINTTLEPGTYYIRVLNTEELNYVDLVYVVSLDVTHVHEHSYTTQVYAPNCVKQGYTVYTCSCGDNYTDNVTPANGVHTYTGACNTQQNCALCGAASNGPVGHRYDDNVDGTCNGCGADRAELDASMRQVVHMFRMYNPNTGEHFYTGSEVERDNLIAAGWQYEGIGFTFPANTGDPVHRLFQPSTGEHLYTMDVAEKDKLMAEGWNYEGIAFNSAYDTEAVQHRLHNPNASVGAYHFTFSEEEMNNLIAAGWEYQGIGWYSCWK